MLSLEFYQYKTISISPEGIRIKGDDVSEKLAQLLNDMSNECGKEKWRIISIIPTMKSEGAVTKILVTFERLFEKESNS
jgi:hypothetical protein|tara:strand:+ start:576 stop:812 length:237 start_codon:yes stop_codon:yes gene_type:complete